MTPAGVRVGAAAFALLLLSGCRSGGGDEVADVVPGEGCAAPSTSVLNAASTLQGAVGDYRLQIMTIREGRVVAAATATLTLTAHTPEMQYLTALDGTVRSDALAPLYGWTDLELGELEALEMSGLDSRDPARPGVGVYETRTAAVPSIVLRLGSAANRREGAAIDGASTALRVLKIEDSYFSGSWRSGVGMEERASGFFCAVALAD